MFKTASLGFTKWVVVMVCLVSLFGFTGFAFAPASASAAMRPAQTTQHIHAPIRNSRPFCASKREGPNGCYGCSWNVVASTNAGWQSGYLVGVMILAQYDNYSGFYCGYAAVEGTLNQPPHSQVGTMSTYLDGCGGGCFLASAYVTVHANNGPTYWTTWGQSSYSDSNGCLYAYNYYLSWLRSAALYCIYV